MNVSLTKELEQLVTDKVESGMYQTASEVVREGLRLLEERDRLYALRLEDLKKDVAAGLASPSVGRLDTAALKGRLAREVGSKKKSRRSTLAEPPSASRQRRTSSRPPGTSPRKRARSSPRIASSTPSATKRTYSPRNR